MKRRAVPFLAMAAVMYGRAAMATHPDYEGERGLELTLMPGLALMTTHDESVFLRPEDLPRVESGVPIDSFGAGFDGALSVGWRFAPFVSAGVTGGYQAWSEAHVYTSGEAQYEPVDSISSWRAGVYGRIYPMAFFNGSRHNPRVFFDSWTDRRRFEPWVSLGVQVGSITRQRDYYNVSVLSSYTRWTTTYVGVPVTLGGEYRILPRLAVGLHVAITPLVAGTATSTAYRREIRPGVDTTTTTTRDYTPAADSNVGVTLGLGVRYTFFN